MSNYPESVKRTNLIIKKIITLDEFVKSITKS